MKNILLIGAGHFGRHIAMQLSQLGHQVMAVDTDEERINDVLPFVTKAHFSVQQASVLLCWVYSLIFLQFHVHGLQYWH